MRRSWRRRCVAVGARGGGGELLAGGARACAWFLGAPARSVLILVHPFVSPSRNKTRRGLKSKPKKGEEQSPPFERFLSGPWGPRGVGSGPLGAAGSGPVRPHQHGEEQGEAGGFWGGSRGFRGGSRGPSLHHAHATFRGHRGCFSAPCLHPPPLCVFSLPGLR